MYKFGVFFGKLITAFLLCSLCAALPLPIAAAQPRLSASSAILINADNGECIAAYNADERRGMASTTKIMTALVAIENGDLDQRYTIPNAALGIEGSSLYLKSGETMTLRELLYGLMLQSANDAAEAIAIIVGGSVEKFADMMNGKAASLGLTDTHFTNPHGLADENHYTTARELARLSAYALQNQTFREICSTYKTTIPAKDGVRWLVNHNKMLSIYDGAYGVKTGFTKATGRCLVSSAERDDVRLVAVTLNAPNDWNDHTALFDYGFSQYEAVELAKAGEIGYTLPLIGGDTDDVPLYIKEDLRVSLPKDRGSIVERVELIRPRFAPIYEGDEVGRIVYMMDGVEISSSPLYAAAYVGKRQTNNSLFKKITDIFG